MKGPMTDVVRAPKGAPRLVCGPFGGAGFKHRPEAKSNATVMKPGGRE